MTIDNLAYFQFSQVNIKSQYKTKFCIQTVFNIPYIIRVNRNDQRNSKRIPQQVETPFTVII